MLDSEEPLNIVLAAWAPFHAGAEVAAERLAIGLRDDGHQITVVLGTHGETFERMRDAHLSVQCVPMAFTDKFSWWRYHSARRQLQGVLRAIQPDVIHANDLPTSQMVGGAAAKVGLPVVCHHRWIFDGEAIDWFNKFGADRHLFVSRALMDALCGVSPKLMASERAVVHDGLPLLIEPVEADRINARNSLGLPTNKSVVLFAGQIIERKGVADLLHAWQQLAPASATQAELVFVGDDLESDGKHRREMESLAAALNCPARFVGYQRNVSQWITAADICVVPSHAEPLGNATLEAMSLGRPVIGSRVGGIPEMIIDGVTGLLVPPRDPSCLAAAIDKLLSNDVLRRRLGEAARQRCEEKFSLRAHVDEIVREYRRVVSRRACVTA